MYILGIETSCDETAAAVVKDGREILSNVVVSQIDIFKEYGGVIPEVAARSHLEAILPVINKALLDAFQDSNLPSDHARLEAAWNRINYIAVTHTPGLLGSLLIGTLTARTLAILHEKPLYAVHHLKSHIYANWLDPSMTKVRKLGDSSNDEEISPREITTSADPSPELEQSEILARVCPDVVISKGETISLFENLLIPNFPLLALVVSGGHTQIIRMTAHNQFEIIGTTRDDAVGECFDKVAKILGLPYPGGPSISKAAEAGDPKKYHFPHPRLTSPNRGEAKYSDLDFSFSGLKTAVLREVQKAVKKPISFPSHELKNLLTKQQVADFAASFENTATDILIENLKKALEKYPDTKSICLAGGVSANKLLQEKTKNHFQNVFVPPLNLSGDNAAMVAAAAFYEIESGVQPTDPYSLNIYPRKPIS